MKIDMGKFKKLPKPHREYLSDKVTRAWLEDHLIKKGATVLQINQTIKILDILKLGNL